MNNKILLLLFASVLLLFSTHLTSAIDRTLFLGDYEITYSYNDVQEGDRFSLTVSILNTGNENKTNVILEIDDNSPFDVDSDRIWEIDSLGPDQSASNTFRIEVDDDIPEDEYSLDFTLEDSRRDFEDQFEISVSSDTPDLIIASITSTPATLSPDMDDVRLEIVIDNMGGGDATFTRARLNLPNGITPANSYSDETNLGTIPAKQSKTAVFFVDIGKTIPAGNNPAELILEYRSGSERDSSTLNFDIPIQGSPLFEIVSSSTDPAAIPAGESGSLRVTVSNVGQVEGKETSVKVFENTDLPLEFNEKTRTIGNLAPGESGSAVFTFDINDDAIQNNYSVKVQVRTVNEGNVQVSDYSVPIEVSASESSNIFYLIIAILIFVALLALLIYLFVRKRKTPED